MKKIVFNKSKSEIFKRGISPVIATVLLIAMVVIIGLVIFLWFKGVMVDYGEKFGKNIELVCADVDFDASYSEGTLYISNLGNVPIFGMQIKALKEGSHETNDLSGFDGLNQGGTFSRDISGDVSDANEITLIPILIGSSKKGEKTFMCNEKQYGYKIII